MKMLIIVTAFLAVHAYGDVVTPTGEKIQFDISASISSCQLNRKGEVVRCEDKTDTRIRETLSGELVHSECKPACKYNDSVDLSKTYKLTIPGTKKTLNYDLSVWFTRGSEVLDDSVPEYTVQAVVGPTHKSNLEDRPALVTVKDMDALKSLMVSAQSVVKKQKDGTYIRLEPAIVLMNFKIVK